MGNIRETTRNIRLHQWAERIRECKSSGMTIRAWCKENDIREKNFYYYQRKVREALLEIKEKKISLDVPKNEVGFAKISGVTLDNVPERPVTAVNVNGIKIDVFEDASEEAIRKSIKAVMSLC